MTDIILCGANGKMGRFISAVVEKRSDSRIVAGVDLNTESQNGYPIFKSIDEINLKANVIIDFSHPSLLDSLLAYSTKNNLALVLATTGYSAEQTAKIREASKSTPIFFTFNMSLGINLLVCLAKKAASVLSDGFDKRVPQNLLM